MSTCRVPSYFLRNEVLCFAVTLYGFKCSFILNLSCVYCFLGTSSDVSFFNCGKRWPYLFWYWKLCMKNVFHVCFTNCSMINGKAPGHFLYIDDMFQRNRKTYLTDGILHFILQLQLPGFLKNMIYIAPLLPPKTTSDRSTYQCSKIFFTACG